MPPSVEPLPAVTAIAATWLGVLSEDVGRWLASRPKLRAWLGFALPLLGLVLAFTLFSLYTVLSKAALNEGTSPLVLALLREVLACSVLLPFAYLNERRHGSPERFWPTHEDRGTFVLLGLMMIWGVQVRQCRRMGDVGVRDCCRLPYSCFVMRMQRRDPHTPTPPHPILHPTTLTRHMKLLSALSLEHLSANTYALLAPSVPVMTAGVAIATGYEPFAWRSPSSWLKLGAICIAVMGALWIALGAYLSSSARDKGSVALGLALLCANKASGEGLSGPLLNTLGTLGSVGTLRPLLPSHTCPPTRPAAHPSTRLPTRLHPTLPSRR